MKNVDRWDNFLYRPRMAKILFWTVAGPMLIPLFAYMLSFPVTLLLWLLTYPLQGTNLPLMEIILYPSLLICLAFSILIVIWLWKSFKKHILSTRDDKSPTL
ncbi:hypothetical protein TRIP_C20197 [Candidatus Zixiibacteriota bacterium]|nr:hypothetical protein TRIP_C20197 [candidate division Zixibacteria bacterium]